MSKPLIPVLNLTLEDLTSTSEVNEVGGVKYFSLPLTNTLQLKDSTLVKIYANKRPPAEEFLTLADGRQIKAQWERMLSFSVVKASAPTKVEAPKVLQTAKIKATKASAPSVEARVDAMEALLQSIASKLGA